ncbi:zinc protease [Comamonas odontotermitis]|uniref:Zinc protease n=1 Tax=Comamonas odontotermitis TaxID=379895 RepID=A0ABR6RDW6_9BURK|nr:pitrilysin family protein [Comamonas odontotermitis]MBB6577353.1 zinc protease [Comamonas odontotermitis]
MHKASCKTLIGGAVALLASHSAWALLPIEHWTQDSGAQVWLVNSPTIPMVDVQINFDAGSRRDPAAQAGLASAAAMMAAKGVKANGAQPALDENAVGEAWADLGATFEAAASNDALSFSLRSLTDSSLLGKAADLAARQMAQPSYDDTVWQRERERWNASIKEGNTRPPVVAARAFGKAVFGSHPYGQRATETSLTQIDPAAMRQYLARSVDACRAKVTMVGALDKAQADALVKRLLAKMPATPRAQCAPPPAVPAVQPLAKAEEIQIAFDSAQAQVLIGQPGIRRADPDFLAVMLGNQILGGGGFASRLMEEVREKRGLVYGVYSTFNPGLDAGAFQIGLQTRPDQAAQALKVTREVLATYIAEGPTDKELRDAKDNLIGGFALRVDSNAKLLGNVTNIAWNGLPLDYLDHWTDRVEALSKEDVRKAMARMVQPDKEVTVVLGAKAGAKTDAKAEAAAAGTQPGAKQ